ncbi:MAG: hypothetical protein ACR2LF_08620 [Jatrophihabitantaceae bacterium]
MIIIALLVWAVRRNAAAHLSAMPANGAPLNTEIIIGRSSGTLHSPNGAPDDSRRL